MGGWILDFLYDFVDFKWSSYFVLYIKYPTIIFLKHIYNPGTIFKEVNYKVFDKLASRNIFVLNVLWTKGLATLYLLTYFVSKIDLLKVLKNLREKLYTSEENISIDRRVMINEMINDQWNGEENT